jgi:hypothetical protein
MGLVQRGIVAAVAYVSNTILAIIFVRAGQPLIQIATGPFSGPFTSVVTLLDAIVPVVIGFIYVIFAVYVLVGPIQEEQAADRSRRVRR